MKMIRVPDERCPEKAIVLKDSVYHSFLGKYYFGQTEMIRYGGDFKAWGGLVNPANSNVNLFLNAYTISNYSDQPITAEGWLSSSITGDEVTSYHFAAGNQAIYPPPIPKVRIKSGNYISGSPLGGTYTFTRRIEANITLTKHDFQGMYIIPPNSSFLLYFLPPGGKEVNVKIAFGWWEEEIHC